MEKKTENIKQFPKSTKPQLEKEETKSKPKIGKIVRIVPMGVPFFPKRFREIHELSQRGPGNKLSKSYKISKKSVYYKPTVTFPASAVQLEQRE